MGVCNRHIVRIHVAVLAATLLLPAGRTVTAQSTDTTVRQQSLSVCSDDFRAAFRQATNNNFGLLVQNLHHHNIYGYYGRLGSWIPIDGYRATFGGIVTSYEVYAGNPGEYDWNIIVHPGASSAAMFSQASSLAESRVTPYERSRWWDLPRSKWHDCGGCNNCCVECEVTPPESFRHSIWFPPKGSGIASPLVGRDVRFYGPWVLDTYHGSRPEIHPAEVIWFQRIKGDSRQIDVMIVQDASNRFDDNSDYIFDTNQDGVAESFPGWRPWVLFPQMEEIKVPFRYDPGTGQYTVIEVEHVQGSNVRTSRYPELADSDDGTNHKLKVTRLPLGVTGIPLPTIVEVNETGSASTRVGVQFSNICLSDDVIMGYVRVLTAVGYPASGAGYQILRITKSSAVNQRRDLRTQPEKMLQVIR
jgi:hypothetical protein